MNALLHHIEAALASVPRESDFLPWLLGDQEAAIRAGTPLVMFSAGQIGKELCQTLDFLGIHPTCFCDNSPAKVGGTYEGLPVISFDQLLAEHRQSLVFIATQAHFTAVKNQLLEAGFPREKILGRILDLGTPFNFMSSLLHTQMTLFRHTLKEKSFLDLYRQDGAKIEAAFNLLEDEKSRTLFMDKLVLIASEGNVELYKKFILTHSEPLRLGMGPSSKAGELHCYFHNDVISLQPDEVYVDIGAFDGDSIHSFIDSCTQRGISYRYIHALEPDPVCFQNLLANTRNCSRLSCHQLGAWSHSGTLRFLSSGKAHLDTNGAICELGDIEIKVVSLDDFLSGPITFIKMDPPGNVMSEVLRGAARLITRNRPKLAVGAYHSPSTLYELPLLVNELCPDYKLYLRHNAWCINETDLFATM